MSAVSLPWFGGNFAGRLDRNPVVVGSGRSELLRKLSRLAESLVLLGRQVLVDSGVKRGDQVILNPAVDLADGAKVRIRREPTQTS